VRTCLAKDPDERWQTAHDVRLQLEWGKRLIIRERVAWAIASDQGCRVAGGSPSS